MTEEQSEIIEEIEPDGVYTVEQCATFLMRVDPSFTFEEACREVRMAISAGDLPIAGYLSS